MCSGKHAVIANGFLTDVGSTNGTVLNGKPVSDLCSYVLLKFTDYKNSFSWQKIGRPSLRRVFF